MIERADLRLRSAWADVAVLGGRWTLECAGAFSGRKNYDEAETIIRSCRRKTPNLWQSSFSACVAELYLCGGSVYSNLTGGLTLLSENPGSPIRLRPGDLHCCWTYDAEKKGVCPRTGIWRHYYMRVDHGFKRK